MRRNTEIKIIQSEVQTWVNFPALQFKLSSALTAVSVSSSLSFSLRFIHRRDVFMSPLFLYSFLLNFCTSSSAPQMNWCAFSFWSQIFMLQRHKLINPLSCVTFYLHRHRLINTQALWSSLRLPSWAYSVQAFR